MISYYLLISLYFFYKQECSSAQIQYHHSSFSTSNTHTRARTHILFLHFSISICWKLQVHTKTFNLNPIPVILLFSLSKFGNAFFFSEKPAFVIPHSYTFCCICFPYMHDLLTPLRLQQPEISSLLTHLDTDSSHTTALTYHMDVLILLQLWHPAILTLSRLWHQANMPSHLLSHQYPTQAI